VPGPAPPPATMTSPYELGGSGCPELPLPVPLCGTATVGPPQLGNGLGAPHTAAKSAMMGVATGIAGPQAGAR
jgi:hypothetical protein